MLCFSQEKVSLITMFSYMASTKATLLTCTAIAERQLPICGYMGGSSWHPGYGCHQNCNGHWLSLSKSEWWVHIQLKEGSTGWLLLQDNSTGLDALADLTAHRPDMARENSVFTHWLGAKRQ
jgi:hypothetical protein